MAVIRSSFHNTELSLKPQSFSRTIWIGAGLMRLTLAGCFRYTSADRWPSPSTPEQSLSPRPQDMRVLSHPPKTSHAYATPAGFLNLSCLNEGSDCLSACTILPSTTVDWNEHFTRSTPVHPRLLRLILVEGVLASQLVLVELCTFCKFIVRSCEGLSKVCSRRPRCIQYRFYPDGTC